MITKIGEYTIAIIYNIPSILNSIYNILYNINKYLLRIMNSLKEFIIRRYINVDYKGDINPPNPPNPLKVPLKVEKKVRKPFKVSKEYKIPVDNEIEIFYGNHRDVPLKEVKYKTVTLEEFIKEFNAKVEKTRSISTKR